MTNLDVDASGDGLGAVLSQIIDNKECVCRDFGFSVASVDMK